MTGVPFAHVGGLPIEETLASLGPALLVAFGVASAQLRARLGRVCAHTSAHASRSRQRARSADGRSKQGTATTRAWPSRKDDTPARSPSRRDCAEISQGEPPHFRSPRMRASAPAPEFTPAADEQQKRDGGGDERWARRG